jgi:hypothetical protein
MHHHLTSQEKVAAIRDFNARQRLPTENINKVLYNGAFFEAPQLNQELFFLPSCNFPRPLSQYPQDEQYVILTKYGATLARVNRPRACFIGVPGQETGNLTVTIHTEEVNLQGYWTLVQRTVFLHQAAPIVSIDIIAPSTVLASPDCLRAPEGTEFIRPADL